MRLKILLLLAGLFLLSGCSGVETPSPLSLPAVSAPEPEPAAAKEEGQAEPAPNYVVQVADEIVTEITEPGMSAPEKAMAAYEYIIVHTEFAPPVGMDIWRYRGGEADTPLSYVENRALSPLVFGVGSCEDYAAALTLLLRQMGFAAEYVPGITISAQGSFVDHAWTAANIGGEWYHLDCQLEDNIIKDDTLLWRYFMRSDTTMLASHRWGQNLVDYGGLSQAQTDELRRNHRLTPCPVDYPTPAYKTIVQDPPIDRDALEQELVLERARFQARSGPLRPLELNTIPPVFAGETYP